LALLKNGEFMSYWRFNYLLEKEIRLFGKRNLSKEEYKRIVEKVKEKLKEEEEEEEEEDKRRKTR
jgi:hypothetical protein